MYNNTMFDDRPIGVIDSGIGGLTLLRNLINSFPTESFIYLGDTAYLPYGNKSEKIIRKRLIQIFKFMNQHKVKALIVACNSSCSVLNPAENWSFPVYNIIESTAKKAVVSSQNRKIGVLATDLTVSQKAYSKIIHKIDPLVEVFEQKAPLLVPLIESGWENNPLITKSLNDYLKPLIEKNIDSLILGCTHYPLIKDKIEKILGSGVEVISCATPIIPILEKEIEEEILQPSNQAKKVLILTTDMTENFKNLAYSILNPFLIDSVQSTNFTSIAKV